MLLPSGLKVFAEKSADIVMGPPLSITSCFSPAAFKSLALFLTFENLIIINAGLLMLGWSSLDSIGTL